MNLLTKIGLAAGLGAVAIAAFIVPEYMIAPGKVITDHQHIANDCFACHTPLLGTSNQKCIACHKPADIGRRTTTGTPIQAAQLRPPFHQFLREDNCLACHTDHAGVMRLQASQKFAHAMLEPETRRACTSCHTPPKDSLHVKVRSECSTCHRDTAWIPATFDHRKYFILDRDHDVACATCHRQNDFSQYTCYGCHEHTRATIRREHLEEGIRDFDNCVTCHRSADEHDIRERGQPLESD